MLGVPPWPADRRRVAWRDGVIPADAPARSPAPRAPRPGRRPPRTYPPSAPRARTSHLVRANSGDAPLAGWPEKGRAARQRAPPTSRRHTRTCPARPPTPRALSGPGPAKDPADMPPSDAHAHHRRRVGSGTAVLPEGAPADAHRARGRRRLPRERASGCFPAAGVLPAADGRPPHALRARQRTRIGCAAVGAFLVSATVDPLLARGRWRPTSEHADGRPSHARALVPPRKRADGGTPSAQPLAPSPQASRRTHTPRVRPSASYPSPRWRPAPLRGTE